ncbi:hypothetical protein BCU68_12365 [Vibrio sp. 10N.286.49.B3]|uniref:oligogalacturonate-specific porin KdgM family protein n=1 Tax=Vibrio sp. 10N.286.49.B3 TaxID=1880855 RepID=UPI000C8192D7|nr:oligogalacturonate-specific porin KdgM family protein [Vibrio sp. 10N.286.49.B3]PMH44635.1 hypothetical protein BCU68_12365 [Vibrio sp. 10N.286.49.B3]
MKAVTKIATLVATTLLAGGAAATSLDYRAEYKHDSKEYTHRIKLGDSTTINDKTKLSFGIEQKFNSQDKSNYWDEMVRGDSEFDWGVRYALNKKWYLQPGMPITFASDKTTYKPQFRVGFTSSFGLTTALRYRHEFQVYSSEAGTKTLTDGTKVSVASKTVEQGKLTLTGSYKFADKELQKIKLSYEANYNKNYDEVRLYNGDKDWQWDAGIIAGYQIGDFRPYVELWNVQVSSSTDERQLRTRLGLKYYF